jgi:hypothetical protein
MNCQYPENNSFIDREYSIIQCSISKDSEEYKGFLDHASELAENVNQSAANSTKEKRDIDRRNHDAFGGVLAEQGWLQLLNRLFGNIATPIPFTDAAHQFDIVFVNGEIAEVRSSFPRNGPRFAICSDESNFKNIGPYSNSVKPGEIQKHLYLGVLFTTQKSRLLNSTNINFCLIGGSTWQMMVDKGINTHLTPEDSIIAIPSNYKVIRFKDALDIDGIINSIEGLGYQKTGEI